MLKNKLILFLVCAWGLLSAGNKQTTQALNVYEKEYGALMNNVVNVSTPGYRSAKLAVREKDGNLVVEEFATSLQNGPLIYSGNYLHVGIDGPGFFMVRTPSGVMFTRDGRFTFNANNELVTLSGQYPVQGQSGTIAIQPGNTYSTEFQITETGAIIHNGQQVNRLAVGVISGQSELKTVNGSFFTSDGGEGSFIILPTPMLKQYYYEGSNVAMNEELVAMPDISKKYDANAKVLQIMKKIQTTGREMGSAQ
ncbi:putative flagellar basal-body rod protein [Candidatus Termititenax persephonae]|uniref:Flagellar basal-body rod protein n=1 Tax=Candidatus Termititenax persephonae TaxID=2218525 RepID=A0A388TG39_9BACT|nr:putative flagellar basal-body rod protein [Candidatus Termititenax persephonae]